MTSAPPPIPDVDAPEPPDHAEDSGSVDLSPGLKERLTGRDWLAVAPLRIAAAVGIPLVGFFLLLLTFTFLRDSDANRLTIVAVALVAGVGGVFALYWGMDFVNNQLPERIAARIRPWIFVGPALSVLALFLVWPTIRTVWLSFLDDDGEAYVGIANYEFAFTDNLMLTAFRNNVIWLIVGTFFTVGLGLLIATLVDKLRRRAETVAKSVIFLPMAISFVGAAVVWSFIYAFRPEGRPQIGLLNAIWTALGGSPIAWLQQEPWNNLLLIVVLVWLQTGFTMVILSAAIKGVPDDILEAARIDGASEIQVFWRVVIPTIQSTIVVVTTTMIILILKVFDIVWVMTSGDFGTEVIASQMIRQAFRFFDNGKGAAIAVILLLAVIPVMVLNIRRFREEEALR
ncbi:MAG: sugar ABC transporter permease [Acidimicrobiia bacterium]|nr:sugar ABC transporter permease [Acidimicrobiia bacterium]